MNMRPALLLVDVQQDYVTRPGLVPPAGAVLENIAGLLAACRKAGIPVFHSRTVVRSDGTNRMPHWKRQDSWACVEGTGGIEAPKAAAPAAGEAVFAKPFYSAFGNAELASALSGKEVSHLIVAGFYTHACIQATVLDAYQAGFDVWVAEDGVASYDPLHAALSRNFLEARACRFAPVDHICEFFGLQGRARAQPAVALPAGRSGGHWLPAEGLHAWPQRDPGDWENCLAHVPLADARQVDRAVGAALEARLEWSLSPVAARAARIRAWAARLEARKAEFVRLLAQEIGKPMKEGAAEIEWAVQLLGSTAERVAGEKDEPVADGVTVRSCPLGVVGLITPWNNPVAIPAGKLAPALAYGNTVVWKPALPAPRTSLLLLQTMDEAGLPASGVNLVFGDAQAGRELARHPGIDALSFTGSSANGKHLAALCAVSGKPLQAELGGNNAVIILDSQDPLALAKELARTMFSFAGQRCTAPRRLIVARSMPPAFKAALIDAIVSLRLGKADDPDTDVGPLISRDAQIRMGALVAGALKDGANLLCGGGVPAGMDHGCWYRPALLENLGVDAQAVAEEAFGPVAVWQEAADFDEALRLCNGVQHGLVASLISDDRDSQRRFLEQAEAGILRLNQLAGLHPEAPFSGWKTSSIGPPEHGTGDRLFYTRMQSVYGGGRG